MSSSWSAAVRQCWWNFWQHPSQRPALYPLHRGRAARLCAQRAKAAAWRWAQDCCQSRVLSGQTPLRKPHFSNSQINHLHTATEHLPSSQHYGMDCMFTQVFRPEFTPQLGADACGAPGPVDALVPAWVWDTGRGSRWDLGTGVQSSKSSKMVRWTILATLPVPHSLLWKQDYEECWFLKVIVLSHSGCILDCAFLYGQQSA